MEPLFNNSGWKPILHFISKRAKTFTALAINGALPTDTIKGE
jgi:hypothetical protein